MGALRTCRSLRGPDLGGTNHVEGVDEEIIFAEDDDVVVRRAAGPRDIPLAHVQHELVRTAAPSREGQATGEDPCEGHVNVAEEDMPNAAGMRAEQGQVCLRLSHTDVLEMRDPDRERRMMLENNDSTIASLGEPRLQPGEPTLAQDTTDTIGFVRIEKQQPPNPTRRVDHALDEPVLVHGMIAERLSERRPPIMISEHQTIGHFQSRNDFCHLGVGVGLAIVRQIARYRYEVGVAMTRVYVFDDGCKPRAAVDTVE